MSISAKDESLFWRKKEYISFILSILVFFIHNSSFAQYASNGTFVSAINDNVSYFFKWTISRFAVPMFFILSGISFFKGYDNKKYFKKIKSRFFSLVIPYLLWNTIWMLFDIVCSHSFLSNYFVGRQVFQLSFKNILWGILYYKSNLPFWYLFDLIVFSLAAPIIYAVIRNKYIGIASAIVITVLNLFNIKLPVSVFFYSPSFIFYLVGAVIGLHYFDIAARKTSKSMQCCSIAFLSAYIILKNIFKPEMGPQQDFLEAIIYTLCAFSVWSIADIILPKIKPRKIHTRSFAIYAMHVNVSAVITKLLYLCLPRQEWMAIPNFILTIVLSITIIHLICILLEKFLPPVYSILMAGKARRPIASVTAY